MSQLYKSDVAGKLSIKTEVEKHIPCPHPGIHRPNSDFSSILYVYIVGSQSIFCEDSLAYGCIIPKGNRTGFLLPLTSASWPKSEVVWASEWKALQAVIRFCPSSLACSGVMGYGGSEHLFSMKMLYLEFIVTHSLTMYGYFSFIFPFTVLWK